MTMRTVRLAAILAFVAVTTGCASINGLRDAQDSFNQATAAEALAKKALTPEEFLGAVKLIADVDGRVIEDKRSSVVSSIAMDPITELARARAGYAAAIAAISKIENDRKELDALKQDKLLGTALTLKALAQWRIGLYTDAAATAERAEQQAGDELFPRDRAVVKALPGLIRNDEAFRKIYRDWPTEQRAQILAEVTRLLDNSQAILKEARALAAQSDKSNPVLVYLIQAQLAGYQNRRDAYYRLGGGKDTSRAERVRAQEDYCALKVVVETLKLPTRVGALADWREKLVLTEGSPPNVPCAN